MSYPATSIIRAVRADTSGAAASEFALLAIPLVLGLLNAVDMGRYEYQRLQVENAAQAGAQAAWHTCNDPSSMLPATQNCSGLQTALTAAIQSTTLGGAVALTSGYPAEGYYCANSSNALQIRRQSLQQTRELLGGGQLGRIPRRLYRDQRELQLRAIVPRRHCRERLGHNVDHVDELDAVGLTMRIARPFSLTSCERGASAVEFALVAPLIFMAMVGTLYGGLLVFSAVGLQNSVEAAARCYSVNSSLCGTSAAAQNYALQAVLWREHAHIRCIDHRVRTSSQRYAHCRIQRGGDERECARGRVGVFSLDWPRGWLRASRKATPHAAGAPP